MRSWNRSASAAPRWPAPSRWRLRGRRGSGRPRRPRIGSAGEAPFAASSIHVCICACVQKPRDLSALHTHPSSQRGRLEGRRQGAARAFRAAGARPPGRSAPAATARGPAWRPDASSSSIVSAAGARVGARGGRRCALRDATLEQPPEEVFALLPAAEPVAELIEAGPQAPRAAPMEDVERAAPEASERDARPGRPLLDVGACGHGAGKVSVGGVIEAGVAGRSGSSDAAPSPPPCGSLTSRGSRCRERSLSSLALPRAPLARGAGRARAQACAPRGSRGRA